MFENEHGTQFIVLTMAVDTAVMETNWTSYQTDLPAGISVVAIIIEIFILINVILVLFVFRRMRRLRMQHYFMVGLTFADLMTLIPHGLSAAILLNGSVILTKTLCDGIGLVWTMTFEVTACIHSIMCIEKCLSVISPLRHRNFTKTRISKLVSGASLTACFLFPCLFNIAMIHLDVVQFEFKKCIPSCSLTNDGGAPSYEVTASVFILLPFVIQLVTHAIMFRMMSRMRAIKRKKIAQAKRTLLLTVIVYYFCWLPTLIQMAWVAVSDADPPDLVTFVSAQLLMANSGVSSVIYMTTLPDFKVALWGPRLSSVAVELN